VHVKMTFTHVNLQSQVNNDVALLTIYQWKFFFVSQFVVASGSSIYFPCSYNFLSSIII
jgi:hypothetical protein